MKILNFRVIFGMLIALPITLVYYILLGLWSYVRKMYMSVQSSINLNYFLEAIVEIWENIMHRADIN